MAIITQEVLDNQFAIRDGTPLPDPTEPIVSDSRSLELEKLFPSVALKFEEFNATGTPLGSELQWLPH